MTHVQVQALVSGMHEYRRESQEAPSVCDWNPASSPDGWCGQFPAVPVARMENESDMPWCVWVMLDETDVLAHDESVE